MFHFSLLNKWSLDTGNHVALAVNDRLDHYAWWPTLDNAIVAKVDCNVPDSVSTWLVVKDKIATLTFRIWNALQVLVGPKVTWIPFIAGMGMTNWTSWSWANPTSVETLHYKTRTVNAVCWTWRTTCKPWLTHILVGLVNHCLNMSRTALPSLRSKRCDVAIYTIPWSLWKT